MHILIHIKVACACAIRTIRTLFWLLGLFQTTLDVLGCLDCFRLPLMCMCHSNPRLLELFELFQTTLDVMHPPSIDSECNSALDTVQMPEQLAVVSSCQGYMQQQGILTSALTLVHVAFSWRNSCSVWLWLDAVAPCNLSRACDTCSFWNASNASSTACAASFSASFAATGSPVVSAHTSPPFFATVPSKPHPIMPTAAFVAAAHVLFVQRSIALLALVHLSNVCNATSTTTAATHALSMPASNVKH